jgi:hypothetical protein
MFNKVRWIILPKSAGGAEPLRLEKTITKIRDHSTQKIEIENFRFQILPGTRWFRPLCAGEFRLMVVSRRMRKGEGEAAEQGGQPSGRRRH